MYNKLVGFLQLLHLGLLTFWKSFSGAQKCKTKHHNYWQKSQSCVDFGKPWGGDNWKPPAAVFWNMGIQYAKQWIGTCGQHGLSILQIDFPCLFILYSSSRFPSQVLVKTFHRPELRLNVAVVVIRLDTVFSLLEIQLWSVYKRLKEFTHNQWWLLNAHLALI